MRVLMINTVCSFGSTGSICVDIANQLTKRGDECYIAYGQGTTDYPKSYKIGTKIENHLHNIGSRVLGRQGYFTKRGTSRLVSFIKEYNPDIIHLHNLHGNYLNLDILFSYLMVYPGKVVWTLHDCWAFTGKCAHYTDVQCYKWETHCSACPQVHSYPPSLFLDRSKSMFGDKVKWVTGLKNLTVMPVSNWLKGEAERSIFKNHRIEMVYNWIDSTVFQPYPKNKIADDYRLDMNKFTVVLVSAAWKPNTVKWNDLLVLSHLLDETYQIIVIGKNNYKNRLTDNCISIDYVDSRDKLAQLYSFSDVYIHLSTEDTFGKVIAEAMSCGTPVVVYNSTACPEIVGKNCGYIIEKRDVEGVKKAIEKIRETTKSHYSPYCRNHVLDTFEYHTNANRIIDIYRA